MPMATNDNARPEASATGPRRCSLTAVTRMIGSSGSTHGESVERMPARKANIVLPRSMGSAYFIAVAISASIDALLVSPAERAVSVLPLYAISVLCCRTLKLFKTSG